VKEDVVDDIGMMKKMLLANKKYVEILLMKTLPIEKDC